MADLLEIRTFIENNLDYAPVNTTWRETVDKYINDVYFRIFTGKAYDFAQKIAKIPVYKDVDMVDVSWSGNAGSPVTVPSPLPAGVRAWPIWCEGQVLEVDGTEFDIVY